MLVTQVMNERVLSKTNRSRKVTKVGVCLTQISINLLLVYRESVNLIGYITRRISADSQQL